MLGARRVHRTRSGHASKHSVGPINTVVTRWHRSVYPATVSMLPKADPLAQRASSKVLQPTEADSRNALCPRRWSIIHTPNQSLIIACRESVTNQINYYLPSPFRATQAARCGKLTTVHLTQTDALTKCAPLHLNTTVRPGQTLARTLRWTACAMLNIVRLPCG